MLKILNSSIVYFIITLVCFTLIVISPDSLVTYIFVLIVISLISISLHELGHFLMGKYVNLTLNMLATPFFFYYRQRFYFNFPIVLGFGYCQMINESVDVDKNVIRHLIFYYLGGGLANLITVFLVHFFTFPYQSEMFIINLVLFIATLIIPMEGNDCYWIKDLLLNAEESKAYQDFISTSLYNNVDATNELFVNLPDREKRFFSKFEKSLINMYFDIRGEKAPFKIDVSEEFNSHSERDIINAYTKLLYEEGKIDFSSEKNSEEVVYVLSRLLYSRRTKDLKKINYLKKLVDVRQEAIIDYILRKEKLL